jgi:hypothetical protein
MITKYFHQKTVLITGAASGIGKKMALLMAEHQVTPDHPRYQCSDGGRSGQSH